MKNKKNKKEKIILLIVVVSAILISSLALANNNELFKNILTKKNSETFPKEEKYYSDGYTDTENFIASSTENSLNTEEIASSTSLTSSSTIDTESSNLNNKDPKEDTITKYGKYLRIKDSCGAYFGGECVRARACPGLSCPVLTSLRDGMVLKTDGEITESDGITWYHIVFDEWVRYPERLSSDLYVSADYVEMIDTVKTKYTKEAKVKNLTNKEIIINLTKQKLYAFNGDDLFMEMEISSGLDDLPTPRGKFNIFEKTPSRYMQGPLPGISDQYYDLPGVPWTMYFTYQGGAIHGAYWHDNFGSQWSHGCVNLKIDEAKKLYDWADLGTTVVVRD